MQNEYDLLVIGAGPGGYVAAIKAAQEGKRVAVFEKKDVGGTCLNRGCIPTKALMHASHLYREIAHGDALGIHAEGITYDIEKMYARKDEVVAQLRSGEEFLLQSNKIDILRSKATIVDRNRVAFEDKDGLHTFKTENILIATGSVPSRPPIEGLSLPGVITSDEMLQQTGTAYKKLVIIGGGVIGVEFATIFSSLGCEVTIIEAMDRILPTMDKEISQNLNMILKKRGVKVNAASTVLHIKDGEDGLTCCFSRKGKEYRISSEAVLVSIGRKANYEGLFGEGFSVDTKHGIVVDNNFQTSVSGVYAIGDVIDGGIQLAHVASAQGTNAVAHMSGKKPVVDLSAVPSCIYTDPEIASVGLTEKEAKGEGIAVKIGKFGMSGNGKSIIEMQDRGFVKLIFDAKTDVLLGAQLMCARATDLISELSTAIINKLTIHQLSSVIRPHPTFTEAITEAVEDAEGRATHIVPKKKSV